MKYLTTYPRRRSHLEPGSFRPVFVAAGKSSEGSTLKNVERLSHELANELEGLGKNIPVLTISGRIALRFILETSGIDRGSQVLVPGYTFKMVYPAILAAGMKPVPVDIDPRTFQMTPLEAEKHITKTTGAILATHLFGMPCDIYGFKKLCESRGIFLIEDCAQALGASAAGETVGMIGDAGFTSFDMSKPLHGFKGGAIFSRNEKLIDTIRKRVLELGVSHESNIKTIFTCYFQHLLIQSVLWRFVMVAITNETLQNVLIGFYRRNEQSEITEENGQNELKESYEPISDSAIMPEPMACMATMNLKSLKSRTARRKEIKHLYEEVLGDTLRFQESGSDTMASEKSKETIHMVVGLSPVDTRKLRKYLAIRGIDIGIMDEVADDCLNVKGSNVEHVFNKAIALPIHAGLSDTDVRYIGDIVKQGILRS